MNITFREYKNADYLACEQLVSKAWGFDQLFASVNLQKIAKSSYTQGALVSSNYKKVAINQGKVVGFLFGYNQSLNNNLFNALLLGLRITFALNLKKNG